MHMNINEKFHNQLFVWQKFSNENLGENLSIPFSKGIFGYVLNFEGEKLNALTSAYPFFYSTWHENSSRLRPFRFCSSWIVSMLIDEKHESSKLFSSLILTYFLGYSYVLLMEHNTPPWYPHLPCSTVMIFYLPQGNLFKLISVLLSEFGMKMYLFSGSYNNGSVCSSPFLSHLLFSLSLLSFIDFYCYSQMDSWYVEENSVYVRFKLHSLITIIVMDFLALWKRWGAEFKGLFKREARFLGLFTLFSLQIHLRLRGCSYDT